MSAGPRLRAGLTDVPVNGMPIRCTTLSARPIARPAKPGEPTRLVATSTTSTNMNVKTTSAANAPPAPIPIIDALCPQPSVPSPTPERV